MKKPKLVRIDLDKPIAELVRKSEHRILGSWAADCSERVLPYFAEKYPEAELFFAKGGDRNSGNIPENEIKVCQEFKIKINRVNIKIIFSLSIFILLN